MRSQLLCYEKEATLLRAEYLVVTKNQLCRVRSLCYTEHSCQDCIERNGSKEHDYHGRMSINVLCNNSVNQCKNGV